MLSQQLKGPFNQITKKTKYTLKPLQWYPNMDFYSNYHPRDSKAMCLSRLMSLFRQL